MKNGDWRPGTGGWRDGVAQPFSAAPQATCRPEGLRYWRHRTGVLLGLGLLLAIGAAADSRAQTPGDGWRTFSGTWSATGTRQTLPTERGLAAITRVSGALVLTGDSGVGVGFAADAIGFDAGAETSTGRAVWTDSRGDRLFSALRGGPLQTGRAITGTITGGTGRWAGATGDYSMTWQFVVAGEGDTIQGRATDVRGRVRLGEGSR